MYDEISKEKDKEIEIFKKMWHLKTTIVPVIVGALAMIKKNTDKCINKITSSPNQYKIQNLHFVKLLISIVSYYQYDRENITKERKHKYIE